MCTIHNVAWHAYGTCKYAGSYMHPVHDKQETLLNVRGSGDSQNLKGQEILRSLYKCKKAILIKYWRGGGGWSFFLHKNRPS